MKTETNKSGWVYAANESDLKEGELVAVYPNGIHVLLAKVDNTIYALSGKCIHMACPLYTGTLEGDVLTCPCHDWRYNVRTGQFLDAAELKLKIYNLKSKKEKLFIEL